MKKRVMALLTGLLIASSAEAKPVPRMPQRRTKGSPEVLGPQGRDREMDGLKGPAHTVVVQETDFKRSFLGILGKWVEGPRLMREETTYDTEGRAIEGAHYEVHGILYNRYWREYDSQGRESKSASADADKRGRICSKVVTTYSYDAESRLTEELSCYADGSPYERMVNAYDARGNLIEEQHYKADGSLCCKEIYAYDDNDKLTEQAYYTAEGGLVYRLSYAYNAKGNKTREVRYQGSVVDWKKTWSYDLNGNVTEFVEYEGDDIVQSKTVTQYDADGNVIHNVVSSYKPNGAVDRRTVAIYDPQQGFEERASYKADGSLDWKEVYSYDTRGNMLEWIWYRTSGVPGHKELHTYDRNSNKIEEVRLDYDAKGSLLSKRVENYDAKKNYLGWAVYMPDGSLVSQLVNSYDEKGNETGWILYDGEGGVRTRWVYTTENDSHGNWIKRRYSMEVGKGRKAALQPRRITYRRITYYPEKQ